MFSQLRMREEQALLAHDYALEQAEEKRLRMWETLCLPGYGSPRSFDI